MQETKIATLLSEQGFRVGGYIDRQYGTATAPGSLLRWYSSLKRKLSPQRILRMRSLDPMTDRDNAIALARLVIQKKNLGISLVPSQALLLSREFLLAVRHDPRNG